MNTKYLPGIAAMAAVVVASNILVQFLFGQWLTWGAFTYPIAFLVTDVMNRLYGTSAARRVVFAGFLVGVACSLIGTQIMGEFGPLVTLADRVGQRDCLPDSAACWTWRSLTGCVRGIGGKRL